MSLLVVELVIRRAPNSGPIPQISSDAVKDKRWCKMEKESNKGNCTVVKGKKITIGIIIISKYHNQEWKAGLLGKSTSQPLFGSYASSG